MSGPKILQEDKTKYTILGKHKFFIFTNRKYGLLTLYKIFSKVHPIISKDNQRLLKTAKARLVFPDAVTLMLSKRCPFEEVTIEANNVKDMAQKMLEMQGEPTTWLWIKDRSSTH